MALAGRADERQFGLDMAQYELRLYMRNACGPALLGEVISVEAADAQAAIAQADRRVRGLPKQCFGVLFDPAGVQIWSEDAPAALATPAHQQE
jgi:hypothetical protein